MDRLMATSTREVLLDDAILVCWSFKLRRPAVELAFVFLEAFSDEFPDRARGSRVPRSAFSMAFLALVPVRV